MYPEKPCSWFNVNICMSVKPFFWGDGRLGCTFNTINKHFRFLFEKGAVPIYD